MSDKLIRQNVIDELDFEPSIDAAHIGVAVDNGIVTLTGQVRGSYAQRTSAEKAVRRVRGVAGVVEEITVRFAGETPRPATRTWPFGRCRCSTGSATVPKTPLQVQVNGGWGDADRSGRMAVQRKRKPTDRSAPRRRVRHHQRDRGDAAEGECAPCPVEDRGGAQAQRRDRGGWDQGDGQGSQGHPRGQGERLVRCAASPRTPGLVGPGVRAVEDRLTLA